MLKTVILLLISLLISIGILIGGIYLYREWNVRKSPVVEKNSNWNLVTCFDRYRFWRGRPNVDNAEMMGGNGTRHYWVSTNSLGLRNKEIQEKGKRFRILAVGDSTTWGYGVADIQTWPFRLQVVLDMTATQIEVINAGVVGYSSYQIYDYLKREGMKLKPDLVLVTCGHNDSSPHKHHDLDLAKGGPLYTIKEFLFDALFNRNGSDSMVETRIPPEDYVQLLLDIKELCRNNDAIPFFISWPSLRVLVDPETHPSYRKYMNEAARLGNVTVIDLFPMAETLIEPIFLDNCHFSVQGNELAANIIARRLNSILTNKLKNYQMPPTITGVDIVTLLKEEGVYAAYKQVVEVDAWLIQNHFSPSLPYAFAHLGFILPDEFDKYAEALLRRSIIMNPSIETPYYQLDRILAQHVDLETRKSEWSKYEGVPAASYLLACIFKEQGKIGEAKKAIDDAISRHSCPKFGTIGYPLYIGACSH